MTNGKTIIEFSHTAAAAVDASRDALTLAIAWATDDKREELEIIRNDLTDVYKRLTRGAKIDVGS